MFEMFSVLNVLSKNDRISLLKISRFFALSTHKETIPVTEFQSSHNYCQFLQKNTLLKVQL